jgi:hypothetical protein
MVFRKNRRNFYRALGFCLLSLSFAASSLAQEFGIRGRLHMDGFYGISQADTFSNGFNNRRARMGMTGRITNGTIKSNYPQGKGDYLNPTGCSEPCVY